MMDPSDSRAPRGEATARPWRIRSFAHAPATPAALELDRWKIIGVQRSALGSLSRADAELIVRAVNSHDAMLAALRECLKWAEHCAEHEKPPLKASAAKAARMGRAAIALATKEDAS